MGRDKAGVQVEGQPLWERQLATMRRLQPAELFISGKLEGPYAGAGVEIVPDITPGRGPLSGLEAALQRAAHPLVLILAIDLPMMTADFLAPLVQGAAASELNGHGCVPRLEGWFEPLAAVYPRRCLLLVQECLRGDDFSMQNFVRRAVELGLVRALDIEPEHRGLFRNVNAPGDITEA